MPLHQSTQNDTPPTFPDNSPVCPSCECTEWQRSESTTWDTPQYLRYEEADTLDHDSVIVHSVIDAYRGDGEEIGDTETGDWYCSNCGFYPSYRSNEALLNRLDEDWRYNS